jgi:hypothetical protein
MNYLDYERLESAPLDAPPFLNLLVANFISRQNIAGIEKAARLMQSAGERWHSPR